MIRYGGEGFGDCDAVLGLYALNGLKLVLDLRNGLVYTTPATGDTTRYPYDYNRAGAVFTPENLETSTDLTGHVAAGGPAYEAGIRDGDVLLRAGDVDVTQWRTTPGFQLHTIFRQAPGTKVQLWLSRGGKPFDVTVTLRDPARVD